MLAFIGPLSTNCVSPICFARKLELHQRLTSFSLKNETTSFPFTPPSIFRVGALQFSRLLGTFRHVFLCRPPHPLHPEHIFEPQYGKIYMLSAASPSLPGGPLPSPPFHFDPLIIGPNRLPLVSGLVRHGGRSVVHLFCSDQLRQFQPAPPSTERGGWVQPP